jgi:hypothetical protein
MFDSFDMYRISPFVPIVKNYFHKIMNVHLLFFESLLFTRTGT